MKKRNNFSLKSKIPEILKLANTYLIPILERLSTLTELLKMDDSKYLDILPYTFQARRENWNISSDI